MADQNLGRWDARPVESIPDADRPPAPSVGWSLDDQPPSDDDRSLDEGATADRGLTFGQGVMVGLVPLIALVVGLIGYRLLTGDEGSTGSGTSVVAAGESSDRSDGADRSDRAAGVAETAGDDGRATSSGRTPETPNSVVVTVEPPVATGTVGDATVELSGALPAGVRSQWTAELGGLAEALGRSLVDDTEELAAGAAGETAPPPELTVGFPGAVVFQEQSPDAFDGDPTAVFEAVAGVLDGGSARLNIVGYADPSDPEAVLLALSRVEHVHEHLVELGVDPDRLTVEARPPGDRTIAGDPASPLDLRADLEFLFGS